MIFTKEDVSTSDEQVEVLYREYKIHYRYCVGSLIYILSTRVDLCFSVHNMGNFSSNPGKVHFEGLVHLLGYMRDIKNLGLKYYASIEDATLSDILRQDIIKNDNQLMMFYDSIWQECPDTGISTGDHPVIYQGGPIDHCTHVTSLVW